MKKDKDEREERKRARDIKSNGCGVDDCVNDSRSIYIHFECETE